MGWGDDIQFNVVADEVKWPESTVAVVLFGVCSGGMLSNHREGAAV